MKIGVDLSPTELAPAGIGQYTISLVSKLVEIDKENEYYSYSTTPKFLPNSENIIIRSPKTLPFNGIRWMKKVSQDAKRKRIDLFISPSNHLFSILFPKTIQFIHDLAPIRYPRFFSLKGRLLYRITTKYVSKRAWHIAVPSETIKEEMLSHAKLHEDKVTVIYPALNPWIVAPGPASLISENLPDKYVLTVSTLEPRKNHVTLIKAFGVLKKRYPEFLPDLRLIVVGKKGWFYNKIFKTVTELGLGSEVIFLGYVPNEQLADVYGRASAFAYLSYYEGFGIPPLEALYFDVPTLVSNLPLFHETLGELVSYADPNDHVKIANQLKLLLEAKPAKTRDNVLERYSWKKSAQVLLQLINETQ